MRIVYLGNFLHSWCTEVHVAADAERIDGVTVDRVQEPQLRTPHTWARWLAQFELRASDADLVIYQRTWGLPDDAIEMWRRLEGRGVKTISYHLDLYVGLNREGTIRDDPFWRTGIVFTADGDPATTAWLAELDIDHRWMPAAISSNEVGHVEAHHPMRWRYGNRVPDIVFVGSAPRTYHQEWPWRRELLDAVAARYGAAFAVLPHNGARIHGTDLSLLYTRVPIVLGDSLSPPGHRNYWSDRFYETVGRSGFLIGPRVPGIEQHFENGVHLELYEIGDLDHVFTLIDAALADPVAATRIKFEGMRHVGLNHTYTHRVRAILESLGLS